MPSKHPRIAGTADLELGQALERVRAATGTESPTRRWCGAVEGAEAELQAGSGRRAAAEELLAVMDSGEFDLDLTAIDRLNGPTSFA